MLKAHYKTQNVIFDYGTSIFIFRYNLFEVASKKLGGNMTREDYQNLIGLESAHRMDQNSCILQTEK